APGKAAMRQTIGSFGISRLRATLPGRLPLARPGKADRSPQGAANGRSVPSRDKRNARTDAKRLLGLQARFPSHLLQVLYIPLDDLAELLRRREGCDGARAFKAPPHIIARQHPLERLVHLVNDRRRRAARKGEPVPAPVVETSKATFRQCRNIGGRRPA